MFALAPSASASICSYTHLCPPTLQPKFTTQSGLFAFLNSCFIFSLYLVNYVPWCVVLRLPGDAVLLDESSISRGPDALAGGDRYSVELTETRN